MKLVLLSCVAAMAVGFASGWLAKPVPERVVLQPIQFNVTDHSPGVYLTNLSYPAMKDHYMHLTIITNP